MEHPHNLQNYKIEREIGQGSFATVFLGHEKITGEKVAIKAVNTGKLNKKLAENLASEITILKEIDHPNIIKLYEIQKTEHFIYLVMEYCEAGDLSQYLRQHYILKESEARNLLRQLASALKILWNNNLIHRDLKPQNLLLQSCKDGSELVLKIADFGFARYMEPTDLAETLCGSPLYMAPEILRYEKYDAKADLWSVGAIAYEMVFGTTPYRAENHVHLLRAIESANESALPFPDSIKIKKLAYSSNFASAARKPSTMSLKIESSDLFRKFLLLLLKKNPSERISFEDFFEHSIFKESIETTGAIQTNSSFKETFADVSFKQPVRASSIDSVIESVLRASEDENNTCSIMELFENIDRKPALFTTLRKYLGLSVVMEAVIQHESQQFISLSLSRSGLSDQRRVKSQSTLLLLYYNIDLLENCLDLLRTVLKRETETNTLEFGHLLKAARSISLKLDSQYEIFDSLKTSTSRGSLLSGSHSTSSSSMSRSNSSQSVSDTTNAPQMLPAPRIENLIYQAACRDAKDGGIQELLEQHEIAHGKYLSSIMLFSSLLSPSEFAPITSKFAQISLHGNENCVNKYIDLLKARIK